MPRPSQERALLALVDHAQQDLWVVNRQGHITLLNDAHCRRWQQAIGITPEPGMVWVKLLPAGFQPQWQAYFDRALAGDRLSVQFRGGFPGSIGLLELRMTPIFREPSANDERLEAGLLEVGLLEDVIPDAVAVSLQEADLPSHSISGLNSPEKKYPLPWQTLAQALPGCVNWVHEDPETGISCWVAMLAVPPTPDAASLLPELQEHSDLAPFLTRFLGRSEASSAADAATCPTLDLQLDRGGGDRPIYQISAQRPLGYPFVLLTVLDVTAPRKLEQLLQESRESYFLAVQGANDGVWDWNLQTNLMYFSPRWKELLGYEDIAIESDPEEWFSRVHPEERHALQQKIHAHLEGLSQYFELEHRVLHRDGNYRWMLARGLAVRDRQGLAYRIAGSQTDITPQKQQQDQGLRDPLTGLFNRVLFLDRVEQALHRIRQTPGYQFSLLLLDLDRFKLVNDSLGHPTGDALLVAIARRLEGGLPPNTTLARLNTDEFCILLPDTPSVEEAILLAKGLQQRLAAPFHLESANGQELFISASTGIVMGSSGEQTAEDLLRKADTAMYRAKLRGRDRYELFETTMQVASIRLLQLEIDLRRAIASPRYPAIPQQFQMQYQPIVCLNSGQITSMEALVRWHHPKRGLISPIEFIPIAEETGLIIPLGEWILAETFQQHQRWQAQLPNQGLPSISVNLSTRQFNQESLPQQIRDLLQGTAGSELAQRLQLKLEITESAIMFDREAAIALLNQLRGMGVHLLLDDFGTGYSSLSYLQHFPLDTVKIDRSFVHRLGSTAESHEIVRTIISLAHKLNMTVVAEGVETPQQAAQLRQMGAEYAQGFLFSKPVSGDAMLQLLQTPPPWTEIECLP